MGTKDITSVEFKRIVRDHKYLPGDVMIGYERDRRSEPVKFTVFKVESIYVFGETDDGEAVKFMRGNVTRWHDSEEIALARKNMLEAGYVWTERKEWGESYWMWWHPAQGHGQYGGTEESPAPQSVDTWGWEAAHCDECGIPLERFKKSLCFYCNFWTEYIGCAEGIRIGHGHFIDGGRQSGKNAHLLGFSGREFKVKMFDGREFNTNNLWSQGNIPERFWDRLPDNAEFVK